MPLTCNIDAKGKALRLIYGFALAIAGLILIWFWARTGDSFLVWAICIAIVVAGAFAIFEGWAGWCVVRAMGFKTPI
jgi:hypothetical protein